MSSISLFSSFPIISYAVAALLMHEVESTIQVDIGCPAFIPTAGGSAALALHAPAYEASIKECNRRYAGVFNFSMTFLTTNIDEADRLTVPFSTDTPFLVAQWYWRRPTNFEGITTVIAPGSLDFEGVHQLTSSWNILCLTTMSRMNSGYTIEPRTTLISFNSVSSGSIVATLVPLLEMHGWTNVYIIADLNSATIYNGVTQEWSRYVSAASATSKPIVRIARLNNQTSFVSYLTEFRAVSRVMIFSVNANYLRRFMLEAHSLNLTTGEYVYICYEPYYFPKQYGYMEWYKANDTMNEVAKEAYRSVLVIQPFNDLAKSNTSETLIQGLLTRFRARTKELYNITLTAFDQPVSDVLSSYAGVFLYAQVLNETLTAYGEDRLRDGRWISQQFLNRTFRVSEDLPSIYVSETGERRVIMAVAQFAGPNVVREPFLVQSYFNGKLGLKVIRNMSETWPGDWPPLNVPRCGYRNEKASCQKDYLLTVGLSCSLPTIFVIICITTIFFRWMWVQYILYNPLWWLLFAEGFYSNRSNQVSPLSSTTRQLSRALPFFPRYGIFNLAPGAASEKDSLQ